MKAPSIIIVVLLLLFSCGQEKEIYLCDPCDLPCDTISFYAPGSCPHCGMKLRKKSELMTEQNLKLNEVQLTTGSGVFLMESNRGKAVKVFYHQPLGYSKESKVLLVIPGAGRNGDSYRDAWIEDAEKYNVLLLSPMFSEEDYPFEEYHLCGLIKEANLLESVEFIEGTNIAKLDETHLTYQFNEEKDGWIFSDFDKIFDLVVAATGSSQETYDVFGHSAGGQILHRMAIFSPHTKSNRIIAANSGFYTLPDLETVMPFGINSTPLSKEDMKKSFAKKLTMLLGELDNEKEDGGTLLRSPTVDKQGTHRLARGEYFYDYAQAQAATLGYEFNWKLEIVPNVGHNHEQMGTAAARLLYEGK